MEATPVVVAVEGGVDVIVGAKEWKESSREERREREKEKKQRKKTRKAKGLGCLDTACSLPVWSCVGENSPSVVQSD